MKRTIIIIATFTILTVFLAAGIRFAMNKNIIGADYFIYYMAGRGAFIDHLSPYDPDITLQTQIGILGHPATANQDQLAFVYPAFALIPLYPLFFLDFGWSQAIWMSANIIVLSGLILSLSKKPKISAFSYLLFFQVAFSLILGNMNGTISSILLVLSAQLFLSPAPSRNTQIIAGCLLAWAVIKPQFIWLFAIFFLIAAIRRKFYPFLIAFAGTVTVLLAGAFVLWPGWLSEWILSMTRYPSYIQASMVIAATLEQILPQPVTQTIVVITIFICLILTVYIFFKSIRKFEKNIVIKTLAWIGFTIYIFHPFGKSYEQLTMLVPLLIWFVLDDESDRWVKASFWMVCLALSWISFYLTLQNIYPRAIYDLILVFFTVWILYLYKDQAGKILLRRA